MTDVIFKLLEALVGFSSGFLFGGVYIGLMIVLGVIPRMVQLIRLRRFVTYLISSLMLGVFTGTVFSFFDYHTNFTPFALVFWGFFHGIFNGMLAAALVEVLNVFPLLARRLHLERYMLMLLMAIVLGKIFGSLIQWLFLNEIIKQFIISF